MFVPIPFTINVSTTTKSMRKEDVSGNKPIFPAPPRSAPEVEFKLMRKAEIKAQEWDENIEKKNTMIGMLGGLGAASAIPSSHVPRIDVLDKVWLPDTGHGKYDEKKGSWRQETSFKSSFVLTCPPSFTTKELSISVSVRRLTHHIYSPLQKYRLDLKVAFPGIGNDLKTSVPIAVVSSMPPPGGDTKWLGPSPEFELPK